MLVDFREGRSGIPAMLTKFGLYFKSVNLWVDYLVGQVSVERKTIPDFIASIQDGRLFRQVDLMSKKSEKSLIILEGGGLYKISKVSKNSLRGIMLWISITKEIPIIRTRDTLDTAETLLLLYKRYEKFNSYSHQEFSAPKVKKVLSPASVELNMLKQLPGVGHIMAKRILFSN